MSEVALQLLAPTVIAAVVSGAAIIAREMVSTRAGSRRSRGERRLLRHAALLDQVQRLWQENARLRREELACRRRQRNLERRCTRLERSCRSLRRRLDGLGRLYRPNRRAESRRRSG